MKNLRIPGILILILVITVSGGIKASNLLEGEFRLNSSYFENFDDRHPGLTAELDLLFKRVSWSDEFLFEINIESGLRRNELSLKPGEAYYRYYGESFDLAAGWQVLSWGTALKFN